MASHHMAASKPISLISYKSALYYLNVSPLLSLRISSQTYPLVAFRKWVTTISPLLMKAYLHTYARRLLHLKNTEWRYVQYAHGPYRSKEPENWLDKNLIQTGNKHGTLLYEARPNKIRINVCSPHLQSEWVKERLKQREGIVRYGIFRLMGNT